MLHTNTYFLLCKNMSLIDRNKKIQKSLFKYNEIGGSMKDYIKLFTIKSDERKRLIIYENTYMNYLIGLFAILSLLLCVFNKVMFALIVFFVFLVISILKILKFHQILRKYHRYQYRIEGSKYSFSNARHFIVEEQSL